MISGLYLIEQIRWQIVRGQPHGIAFCAVEPAASQPQELRQAPRQAREIAAAANIREQADPGFRHGIDRSFGGDAIFARTGDAHATTHRDTVHEHHSRLGISVHHVVHLVFLIEERIPDRTVPFRALRDTDNISTRTKTAPISMIDQHDADIRVIAPFHQGRGHRPDHIKCQGIDRARPVEPQTPCLAINEAQRMVWLLSSHGDVLGCGHCFPAKMKRPGAASITG